jgi:dihydrofolate reductase
MTHMRRIVTFNRVTADGFFSGPHGNLDWAVPEPALDRSAAESLSGADAMLFGRRTYELFEGFWPQAIDDLETTPDPHAPGRRSAEIHQIGVWINQAAKLVVSSTLKNVTWKNSRILPALDPEEIENLKRQPGKDIMVFGSGSIVAQLTEHGLVDEYQFIVNPILLGSGRPLLSGVPESTALDLLEAASYPSGNVKLRYARRALGRRNFSAT